MSEKKYLDLNGVKILKQNIDEKIPTLVAGDNITLTTDTDTNEITISSTGGGSGTDLTELENAISEINSDLANGVTANDRTLTGGTLTSPSQLTHPGFYNITTIDGTVNDNVTSGYTYTETSIGDYRCLLLAEKGHCTEASGCNYGTLIVTTPRTDNVWVGRISAYKFVSWKKVMLNSDLGSCPLVYSSTEPTSHLVSNMVWIG